MPIAPCPDFRLQATVSLFGHDYLATDLSHDIGPSNPTFVGHQRTVLWDHLTHEETIRSGLTKAPYSYRVVGMLLCDHTSTHVDAINHIVPEPGARAIDELPLEWFIVPGVWFDFSYLPPNAYITRRDVEQAIEKTGVTIRPNSVVLNYTGWYRKWGQPYDYIKDYPGVDREAMEFLADRGVINVGADAPSIDSHAEVARIKVQPGHIVCRERRIMNMENMANIDLIPKHEFWFIGLPLKLHNATGSPIRAVALTEL